MGYIDASGKYVKGVPNVSLLLPRPTSTHKAAGHDQQRLDHARDLVQPYKRDGTINDEFIAAFPDDAKEIYKFVESDEERLQRG